MTAPEQPPPPPSKEQTHREFYEAFHAWFMQSGCDFWSECDAPESLATIAVEMSDRALMQSMPIVHEGGLATPPPGDAGERARALFRHLLRYSRAIDYLTDRQIAERSEELATALQSERTAAAAQARRETLLECARLCDDAVSDVTGDSAACMAIRIALRTMSSRFRALATPQESAS